MAYERMERLNTASNGMDSELSQDEVMKIQQENLASDYATLAERMKDFIDENGNLRIPLDMRRETAPKLNRNMDAPEQLLKGYAPTKDNLITKTDAEGNKTTEERYKSAYSLEQHMRTGQGLNYQGANAENAIAYDLRLAQEAMDLAEKIS